MNTVSIDMHSHPNIHRKSQRVRASRISKIIENIAHLSILCITEHAYKDPKEAFDHVQSVSQERGGISTEFVAGVEAISQEGIDIIVLFKDAQTLNNDEVFTRPFSWSIHDLQSMKHPDYIFVLPHAFTPSSTGLITNLGLTQAQTYFNCFDYIERGNGNYIDALIIQQQIQKVEALLGTFGTKIKNTAEFPKEFIPEGMGLSVGSDSHFPQGYNIYGEGEFDGEKNTFENLQKGIEFHPIRKTGSLRDTIKRTIRNIGVSYPEYLIKKDILRNMSG